MENDKWENERYADALFALLRMALNGLPTEMPELEVHEWWSLFRLAQQNRVAALCADVFAFLPDDKQPPRDVLMPWLAEQQKAESRYYQRQRVEHEIHSLMQRHGIEMLTLKGTRLAALYPTPEHREFGDLDLYFYDLHEKADTIARQELGVNISDDRNHHTKYNYHGVTIESHYHLLDHNHPRSNRTYELRLLQLLGSPTFDVLYLLRHMAIHFASSRLTLRDLCDLYLVLRNSEQSVPLSVITDTVKEYGMDSFLLLLGAIIERRFGYHCPIWTGELEDGILRMEHDIVFGSPTTEEHGSDGLSRLAWKLRRYHSNRWKRQLAFNAPPLSLFLTSLTSHAINPRSITHKI